MLIETTNQTQLHIDRQAQLENSAEYISSFLSNIKNLTLTSIIIALCVVVQVAI